MMEIKETLSKSKIDLSSSAGITQSPSEATKQLVKNEGSSDIKPQHRKPQNKNSKNKEN